MRKVRTALATLLGLGSGLAARAMLRRRRRGRPADPLAAERRDGDALTAGFRSLWREVDGTSMHAIYNRPPEPGETPVVLVHGLGLSHRYMMPVAQELAADFAIYLPDLPGFGDSADPDHILTVEELGDALACWIEAAGLDQVALLGNSFGCQVIVETAARHPQRVKRAILQGPTTPTTERSWAKQAVRWRQNENPDQMGRLARDDYIRAGPIRTLTTFHRSLRHRVEQRLHLIEAPLLVVRGELDPICRQAWAEEVVRRAPRGELAMLPGARHTLVFTAPVQLADICRPWLRGRVLPEWSRPQQVGAGAAAREAANGSQRLRRGSPRWIAGFDSASAMLRALGRFHRGKDFPNLGLFPRALQPVMRLYSASVNRLPPRLRRQVYIWSGWGSAIAENKLDQVDASRAAEWVVQQYQEPRYPVIAIGSSNGALLHLCSAMKIPWLPQTFLVPVRRSGGQLDDPDEDLAWGRRVARPLLEANPNLQLHHMHDPVQDRLMVRRMSYFRFKQQRLPDCWRAFLTERLPPGGTLLINDCQLRWPVTRVEDRHVFQFGALGGIAPEEYLQGSPRVASFLAEQGAEQRQWQAPQPDAEAPEAEWGFAPELLADLQALSKERGWTIQRLSYPHPESLSPMVADLYRWWYRRRGIASERLLVGSFILNEPWWTLRTGSVPFWTAFSVEPSAEALECYLRDKDDWREIYLMLFSHGVESVGHAPADRWQALARQHAAQAALIGVDAEAHPRDFASMVAYHHELPRKISARYPMPEPLSWSAFMAFIDEQGLAPDVDLQRVD